MHKGCMRDFQNGKQVVDKLRSMGFSFQYMPNVFKFKCSNCSNEFDYQTFESKCPKCNMVYGVTPCHAFDPENIMPAGVNY